MSVEWSWLLIVLLMVAIFAFVSVIDPLGLDLPWDEETAERCEVRWSNHICKYLRQHAGAEHVCACGESYSDARPMTGESA